MCISLLAQSESCPGQHGKADLFEKRNRLEAENARIMRLLAQLVSRNQKPNSNHHHGKGKARNPKRHVPLDLLC